MIERDGFNAPTEREVGLFGIYWFILETNDGGIHQFFLNDSGRLAPPALRRLEKIGAAKTVSILQRAVELFPDGNVPVDVNARRDRPSLMVERGISFNPLTDELFSCSEDVNALHVVYARSHPDPFTRIRGQPVNRPGEATAGTA